MNNIAVDTRDLWMDLTIIVLLFIGITRYKSLLLKSIIFISFYPTVVLLLYKYGFPMKGSLSNEYDFFSKQIREFAFYSSCIACFCLWLFLLPLRKKTFQYKRIRFSPFVRLVLAGLYMGAVILTVPRAFGINTGVNTGSIGLTISTLIVASKERKFDLASILHMCFLTLMVVFGERVDAILCLVLHLLLDGNGKYLYESYKTKFIYPTFLVIFVLGLFTETVRMKSHFTPEYVVAQVFTQRTAVDVSYIYLTGVYYYKTKGKTEKPLYNALFGMIPGKYAGIHSKYNYTFFLKDQVLDNPGGGLYYTEGVLVFGLLGVFIYPFVLSLAIRLFFNRDGPIMTMLFCLLYIMQLRMQWYGMIYIYTPAMIVFVIGWWYKGEISQMDLLRRVRRMPLSSHL